MRMTMVYSIAGGVLLASASAANAQSTAATAAEAGAQSGGPRSQDIAATNRQIDNDYNTLAGRGVKVTDQDRANSGRKHSPATAATAADIKAGAVLRDIKGVQIGTIVSTDSYQAIVDTGLGKIGVPLIGFGKNDQALLLSMTAAKFNQMVTQAQTRPQAQPTQPN